MKKIKLSIAFLMLVSLIFLSTKTKAIEPEVKKLPGILVGTNIYCPADGPYTCIISTSKDE